MRTSFLFDAEQETPESLARRRELAEAILQRSAGAAPSNIGEGLSAIGQALGARISLNRVGKAEAAGRSKALESFNSIFGGGGGQTVDAVKTGAGSYEVPMPSGGGSSYRDAIAKIESGGRYDIVGPTHPKMGRALGKYQVMEANVGPWSRQVLGREVSADEFLRTPELQDQIFDGIFNGYVEKFGPEGAAQAWFGGPGGVGKAGRKDSLGTSIGKYGQMFMSQIGGRATNPVSDASMLDMRRGTIDAGVNPAEFMDTRPGRVGTGEDPASFRQPLQVASADPNFNFAPEAPMEPRQRVAQAMMSNAQPAQAQPTQMAQAQGGFDPRILEALSNPYLPEGHKRVLGAMLEQQMKAMQPPDPMTLLDMEKKRLEIESLRNPQMSPYEREQLAIRRQEIEAEQEKLMQLSPGTTVYDPQQRQPVFTAPTKDDRPWWVRDDGTVDPAQIENQRAGKPETTISMGESDKFYENLDKKNAETFSALSETGVQSRAKLAQIDRLEGLLATAPQGAAAMLKQFAGEYGIPTDGLSDIQAAQALINELVPQQRQPGSGPMSDADLALFKQSLPRLINQPGGNQIIIDTMRGITQYQMQMGEIADMVADRDITPSEGRKRIRALANPLDGLGKKVAAPAAASAPQADEVIKSPKIGDIVEGYEYLGGELSDMKSWKKVSP